MKSRILKGVSAILIFLFCVVLFLGMVLQANAKSINSYFGFGGGTLGTGGSFESEFGELNAENLKKLKAADAEFTTQELEEGSVLLTNKIKGEKSALPLEKNERAVTLFGRASADYVARGIAGGPSADTSREKNFLTSFKEAGFTVNETLYNAYKNSSTRRTTTADTTASIGEEPKSFYTDSLKSSFANYKDAAIVVLSRYGGESLDMQTTDADGVSQLSLHQSEKDMLELVKNSGFGKIIVLLNTVYAIDMGWLDEYNVDACLWIGNPGYYGLPGVVNILKGDANPSGKLPETFATNTLSSAAMQNFGDYYYENYKAAGLDGYSNRYVVYQEGIYVGYKYYETRYEDAILNQGNATGSAGVYASSDNSWNYAAEMGYPFGYGMSYTSFKQTLDSVTYDEAKDEFTATVTVENIGNEAGKDVIEIYVQLPYVAHKHGSTDCKVEKSAIQLVAYDKTDILEKEDDPATADVNEKKKTYTVTFDRYLIASYDTNAHNGKGGYILDAGTYYFSLGNGAHEALNNVLSVKGATGLVDHNGEAATVNADAVKTYEVSAYDEESYKVSQYSDKEVNNLFADADPAYYDQAVTYLTRSDWQGTFPKAVKLTASDKIKNALSNSTKASASTTKAKDYTYGVDSGLTLYEMIKVKDYNDERWQKLVEQMSLVELGTICMTNFGSGYIESVGRPTTVESEGPEGCRGNYIVDGDNGIATGYAGLPVLAATWSHDLQKRFAQLFAENCLYCGIDLINGPGADLIRTPYGGRASEYFSEDAILTYYSAANVVNEMTDKGVIANLKHFFLNEQEAARQGVSTWCNEQAIREIYLRAYEKSFTDGHLLASMSSYSRTGTKYNGANKALLVDLVRGEWNFKGYMNIDYISESTLSVGVDCIKNGSDVLMGNEDRSKLLARAARDDGDLLGAMQESAHRILYAFANSQMANRLSSDGSSGSGEYRGWWQDALIAAYAILGVVATASVGAYVYFGYFHKAKKKEEVGDDETVSKPEE